MKSVTLFFPGQGSQYVGMGTKGELDSNLFALADKKLGFELSKLMFEGPEEELKLTQFTQPAIVLHSVALFEKIKKLLEEKQIKIDRVLGHSVGEYAALVAAGSLSLENALVAVHERGKAMQAATPEGVGTMYALLKVPENMVREACKESSVNNEVVAPANFNEPNQIVISGHNGACERAVAWLKEHFADPHRAIELKVSAPFHCPLMQPAAEKLSRTLDELEFHSNKVAYIPNVTAKVLDAGTDPKMIKENLITQVAGSVLWTQSVKSLPDNSLCLEVGPGKVLTGLAKKINPTLEVIPMDDEKGFSILKEKLA